MVTGSYDGFHDEDVFRGDAVDLTGINRVDLQDRRGIFVRIKPKIQNGSSGYLALITNPIFFLCVCQVGILASSTAFVYMHVGGEMAFA